MNLTTLGQKNDATPSPSDSKNQIVDTRTELAQPVAPAATISGMPVYLPAVAAANTGASKQNQNQNQTPATNPGQTNAASGSPTPGGTTSNSSTSGGWWTQQPVNNNSNGSLAPPGGGFTQSSPMSTMLGATPPTVATDSPTTPTQLTFIDPPGTPGAPNPVPEPSVGLMMLAGCAALLVARRRRTA